MKQYQFKTLNLPVQNTFTSNSFTNKESYTNNNQSVIAPTSVYRNYHEQSNTNPTSINNSTTIRSVSKQRNEYSNVNAVNANDQSANISNMKSKLD